MWHLRLKVKRLKLTCCSHAACHLYRHRVGHMLYVSIPFVTVKNEAKLILQTAQCSKQAVNITCSLITHHKAVAWMTGKLLADSCHPLRHHFQLLCSGRWYREKYLQIILHSICRTHVKPVINNVLILFLNSVHLNLNEIYLKPFLITGANHHTKLHLL